MDDDKYIGIAQKLSEVAQFQQEQFEKIIQSASIVQISASRSIESAIKELDKVNTLKNTLPQEVLTTPAIEIARQANLAISKISISPILEEINKNLINISDQWKKQILSVNQTLGASLLGIQSQISKISKISLLAEKSLLNVDFNLIGNLVSGSLDKWNLIKNNQLSFNESFTSLFESLAEKQTSILANVPVVSTIPPIEFYNNNRYLEVLSIIEEDKYIEVPLDSELAKETNEELESLLRLLDFSLLRLWIGAKESLSSDNPDAVRHFSISSRELLTQIIHKLSPDDEVKLWSNLPEHYHNGRPTRKARLLFICRRINNGQFRNFVEKDIDTLLTCIDIFQEGTHAINTPLTLFQLETLKNRVDSSIRFLLRIWQETRDS